jgi:molybdopterin-guanine dinucleotide biosynthesis protein A
VLAGGRSSRFGRDKLAEPIDGRPMLHHAIAAVRALTEEIVVVAGVEGGLSVPDGVTVVHDDRPFEGPLAALDIGLSGSTADRVIVVAGDMPTLVPAVLGRLLAAVGGDATAAILEVEGPRAVLPVAFATGPATAAIRSLVDAGERRLGAILEAMDLGVVQSAEWRIDDPDGLTLRDIDTRADI